jgi:PAS domain S-box-containing protein
MKDRLQLLIGSAELTQASLTVVDMSTSLQPLIHVNDGFEKLTQYGREDVLGRNCRFLQGPLTSQDAVRNIRESIERRESFRQDLINYRRDGSPFWNRLVLLPLELDKRTYFVGFQHDVTSRKPEIQHVRIQEPKELRQISSAEIGDRINNPLTVAFFNIEKLASNMDGKTEEAMDRVRTAMATVSSYVLSID